MDDLAPITVLCGGVVIDGRGGPGVRADVAIRGDKILAVGDVSPLPAAVRIEVGGHVVAPGFIDVHTHDDLICLRQPDMTAKVSQGVTTVIVGNCGLSPAPLTLDGEPPEPFNLLGPAEAFRYGRFAAYAEAVDAVRPRVNVAALIGHSALRLACMDDLSGPARAPELQAMQALLAEAMALGALGLSSGVFYGPAQGADLDELTALAATVAEAGGVYAAHIRSETDALIPALEEAFAACAPARAALILSHHKCAGPRNWGRAAQTLGLIDRARRDQPVHLDCYPYTAGSTMIRPDLADGEIEILINWSRPHPECAGQSLKAIAETWGCDQPTAAMRLAPGGASYFQMHEDDVQQILRHPACMIGSDGLPEDPLPHPRLWGTFPRVLGHYARDLGLMPLETAVHKMTGLAAQTFGLTDRGVIAAGKAADLTVFNPETVRDRATYQDPKQLADGIAQVWVGGALAWAQMGLTPTRNGRFLRREAR